MNHLLIAALEEIIVRKFVVNQKNSFIDPPGATYNQAVWHRDLPYIRRDVSVLASKTGWAIDQLCGLTYPLSNMLLSLSNYLVRRSEAEKLRLSELERTKQSGRRHVKYKTHLPAVMGWLVNKYTLLPAYLLQKLFRHSEKALVLYFEARPLKKGVNDA